MSAATRSKPWRTTQAGAMEAVRKRGLDPRTIALDSMSRDGYFEIQYDKNGRFILDHQSELGMVWREWPEGLAEEMFA